MFTECLGLECVEPWREGRSHKLLRNSVRLKCEAIRIGGSQKDQSPANSSGFSSNKSQCGIEITNKPDRRKIRSSSLIKGPQMDVASIKRRFVSPK